MKALVIGASGQLGQDLLRALGHSALGVTHGQVDVTDGLSVLQLMQAYRPDWVLNTAAFHRVDDCEVNCALAMAVNAIGAFNVARASADVGARHVFFSTDYVFGGGPTRWRGMPWLESDTPSPLNVYGTSKLAGEQLVRQACPTALVIRSSGLYGRSTSRKGWTFPDLMLELARTQGTVRVVDDQVLSPTSTADLADWTVRLMNDGTSGVVHATNSGECSWFEFAAATFAFTGTAVTLQSQSTTDTARRARRPSYSALASSRLVQPMRPWQDALSDYLRQKTERAAIG